MSCLEVEFFVHRDEVCATHDKSGHVEIGDLARFGDLTIEDLHRAGLLVPKEIVSSAELRNYEVSPVGRQYLKELKSLSLIFVRPRRLVDLVHLIGPK